MQTDIFEQLVHTCLDGTAAAADEEQVFAAAEEDPRLARRLVELSQMHAALQAAQHDAAVFSHRTVGLLSHKGRSGAFAARVKRNLAQERSSRSAARRRTGNRPARSHRDRSNRTRSTSSVSVAHWLIPMAAAALVMLVVALAGRDETVPPSAPTAMYVTSLSGEAALMTSATEGISLQVGSRVAPGNRVRTGADARLDLSYPDGTSVRLQSDTTLATVGGTSAKVLRLLAGTAELDVAPQPAGLPLQIRTRHASATVIGTAFSVQLRGDRTRLDVSKGCVRFQRVTDGTVVDLLAGQFAEAGTDTTPPPADRRPADALAAAETEDLAPPEMPAVPEAPAPAQATDAENKYREPNPDDLLAGEFRTDDCRLMYRLFVPPDYDPQRKYPLVLFLHGIGERGDDNLRQVAHRANGAFAFIAAERQEKSPAFFLAPQYGNTKRHWEGDDALTCLYELLQSLQQEYSIDPDRLYITGLSAGGFGTWAMIARYPDLFAAALPICGGAPGLGKRPFPESLRQLPIWVFHGAKDTTVHVRNSRNAVEVLRQNGCSPRYTEFPDGSHAIWNRAFGDPEVIDWVFRQRRSR